MNKVQIIPLGGLGEIGKNMTVIKYNEDVFIVDAGLAFPEEDLLGIDVIIPDFDYVRKNKENVKKIFITHGHEDHIGALPYFLKEFPDITLFATKLTAELIKNKLKNDKVTFHNIKIIDEKSRLKSGECEISFFPTNHSIPDSVGVVIETPIGAVVHTGDFKMDYTPVDKRYTDFQRLGEIGKNGVLALLSDSTNAEKPGMSLSEKKIAENLENVVKTRNGRIIVATFASSLYRVQNLITIAHNVNRKVVVLGRSMENNVKIASKLGFLEVPDDLLISAKEIEKYQDNEVMIITTGAQGEPLAGLSRIANGDHRFVELQGNDTVIFSSSPIPGNEKSVFALIDLFLKKGVEVIHGKEKEIHTSGHGNQEEQKLMLSILRPKYFIPAHGEYRMLLKHKELAKGVGIEADNIFVCENGDVIEITENEAMVKEKVQAGAVLVDNSGLGDIDLSVIRDRRRLAEHGVAVVQATCPSGKDKKVKVEFVLKGIVAKYDKRALNAELTKVISEKLEEKSQLGQIKRELYGEVGNVIYQHVKRNPTIILLINNFRKKEGFNSKVSK
jgi:ribonuclease J